MFCEACGCLTCACVEMAKAKVAMKDFGKVAPVVASCNRLAGPFAFGPFCDMPSESEVVRARFVGPGGTVAR